MELEFCDLEGRFIRMEPFASELKDEVRAAVDCDPETWDIMPINPMGAVFESYWAVACGAPTEERMSYAIRRRSDSRVVGMSSYYTALAGQGGVEIGTTFLHPHLFNHAAWHRRRRERMEDLPGIFHCLGRRGHWLPDLRWHSLAKAALRS